MINYNNKKFRVKSNSENGEVSSNLIFHYKQIGNVLTCQYTDEAILQGHILGLVDDDGTINLSYHHINTDFELKTGVCTSEPVLLTDGKLQIHESWQWTNGDLSAGFSILEEV